MMNGFFLMPTLLPQRARIIYTFGRSYARPWGNELLPCRAMGHQILRNLHILRPAIIGGFARGAPCWEWKGCCGRLWSQAISSLFCPLEPLLGASHRRGAWPEVGLGLRGVEGKLLDRPRAVKQPIVMCVGPTQLQRTAGKEALVESGNRRSGLHQAGERAMHLAEKRMRLSCLALGALRLLWKEKFAIKCAIVRRLDEVCFPGV
jgi:hypothetical protein